MKRRDLIKVTQGVKQVEIYDQNLLKLLNDGEVSFLCPETGKIFSGFDTVESLYPIFPTSTDSRERDSSKHYLRKVRIGHGYDILDLRSGRVLLDTFDSIRFFAGDYFFLSQEESKGYSRFGLYHGLHNRLIIPVEYDQIDYLSRGFFRVKRNLFYGLYSSDSADNNLRLPAKYTGIELAPFNQGFVVFDGNIKMSLTF